MRGSLQQSMDGSSVSFHVAEGSVLERFLAVMASLPSPGSYDPRKFQAVRDLYECIHDADREKRYELVICAYQALMRFKDQVVHGYPLGEEMLRARARDYAVLIVQAGNIEESIKNWRDLFGAIPLGQGLYEQHVTIAFAFNCFALSTGNQDIWRMAADEVWQSIVQHDIDRYGRARFMNVKQLNIFNRKLDRPLFREASSHVRRERQSNNSQSELLFFGMPAPLIQLPSFFQASSQQTVQTPCRPPFFERPPVIGEAGAVEPVVKQNPTRYMWNPYAMKDNKVILGQKSDVLPCLRGNKL